MGLYSDNYYSWMDEHFARPSLDEETMAEHDKHYHKGGYNPETDRCEKRDKEKDTDSNNSSLPPFTEKMLLDRFGMKVQPFDIDMDGEEAKRFTSPYFVEEWKTYAQQPDEGSLKHTMSIVGNVLADIEERFGCKLKVDNLLMAQFLPIAGKYGIAGASLADRMYADESMMAIATNIPDWDGRNYGHHGSRYQEDVVRHELAHTLTTQDVISQFEGFQQSLSTELSPRLVNRLWVIWGSKYAIEMGDLREIIAEVFSRVTDREYQKGQLPEELENIVINSMLGVGK